MSCSGSHSGNEESGSIMTRGTPSYDATDCPGCFRHRHTCRGLSVGKQAGSLWRPEHGSGNSELASPRGHHSGLRRSLGPLALHLGTSHAFDAVSGERSPDLRTMTFVFISIYTGTVLLCVGTVAWIVRAWTRRRYWHKSPSDLHYIVAGAALLASAGIGVLIASQIVVALGYAG